MIVLTAVLLAAAAYAQSHIPRFTANARNVTIARLTLLVVGVALGYVSATVYPLTGLAAVLAFLSGFGAVHVPAAFILLIKRGRGAGPT